MVWLEGGLSGWFPAMVCALQTSPNMNCSESICAMCPALTCPIQSWANSATMDKTMDSCSLRERGARKVTAKLSR